MCLSWRGPHLAIMEDGSNVLVVISATESCSWCALSAAMTGASDKGMQWILGYRTKLVCNSLTSIFKAPSDHNEAVSDVITSEISFHSSTMQHPISFERNITSFLDLFSPCLESLGSLL
uniref:Uncharacterized protein n=1 Tax=Opuntia streptacantha TaxID=393608 RepID=A0A7C8YFW8_OPUST